MPIPGSGRGLELFVIQICCGVIVYVAVFLRIWAQYINRQQLSPRDNSKKGGRQLHDILMYGSVFLYTTQAIVIIRGIIAGGIGEHAYNISKKEATIGFQTWYFGELTHGILSCLVKTSVILFMQKAYIGNSRTVKATDRPFVRWGLHICLRVIWAISIVFLTTSIFQCSPPSHYWRQFEEPSREGTCLRTIVPAVGVALSVITAAVDCTLALVSIVALIKIRTSGKNKAIIGALSSLGILAGAFMIVRMFCIRMLDLDKDFLYDTVNVAKWTVIEAATGIVAGCLPTTRPLWKRLRPRRESWSPPATEFWACRTHAERASPIRNAPNGEGIYVKKSFSQVQAWHNTGVSVSTKALPKPTQDHAVLTPPSAIKATINSAGIDT